MFSFEPLRTAGALLDLRGQDGGAPFAQPDTAPDASADVALRHA